MQTQLEQPEPPVMQDAQIRSRRWVGPVLLLGLAGALGALLLAGVLPRHARVQALAEGATAHKPTVSIIIAAPGDAAAEVVLPSSVEALQEAPLYPRVNGYVKRLQADIGALVKAGDVLAEIETPELDQQVNQARAALAQAAANYDLAAISFSRWQELQKSRVVAPQEVDERKGALEARKADQAAAEANLQRLEQMQSFQKITAPFSGTVTKRLVEVGQLVTGDLNDDTRILFHLQNTSALRAFVNVPQSYHRFVSVGQKVTLTFNEYPGRTFTAEVVRTAGALDGATRTLRTEIHAANEAGELLPGLYAEVRLQVQRAHPPVTVPGRAIIIQSAGPQVATVDEAGVLAMRPVVLGRDFGKNVEIASGLEAGSRVVVNPNDTLRDGMSVQVETPAPAPAKIASR